MKVAIIGSGPCGLMASISIKIKHPEYQVVLYEKDKNIGSRIKISGNGRCNFLNASLETKDYSSTFVNHILPHIQEVKDIFDNEGLLYYYDQEGRAYPNSESSLTIISLFEDLLKKYDVEVRTSTLVTSIKKENHTYLINDLDTYDKLVVAIGGISYLNEKLNYNRIVSELELKLTKLTPSLAPISVSHFPKELENKKIKCEVKLLKNKQEIFKEKGEVLFKKDGLSGIVIFNLSSVLARLHLNDYQGYQVSLNLLPELSDEQIEKLIQKNPSLDHIFIRELASYLSSFNDPLEKIRNLTFDIRGIYEFKNSQVTCGGVSLSEVNDNLSLKKDPNIFLGGEFLDLDGRCGGYNISLALATGYFIGQNI